MSVDIQSRLWQPDRVVIQINLQIAFGWVIRDLRREAGLSQEELAYQCDLHRTYISQLERGLKSPSLTTINTLATVLGKPPHQLVKAAEDILK